jgi:hypothetical protein
VIMLTSCGQEVHTVPTEDLIVVKTTINTNGYTSYLLSSLHSKRYKRQYLYRTHYKFAAGDTIKFFPIIHHMRKVPKNYKSDSFFKREAKKILSDD